MNNTTISPETLPAIAWKHHPVITTELLASVYGVQDKQIRQNFVNNSNKFSEGIHYFKLTGEDLKSFKNQVEIFDLVEIAKNTAHLMLWTERGTVRHAKMLGTDQAWDVQDRLEEFYFSKQLLENIEQLPEPKTKQALAGGLTLEQQDCIKALIRQRVTELPKDKQGGAAVICWSSIKKKYGKTYKAVEPEHFTSIISLLGRLPLEGELVEPDPIQQDSITINLAPLGKGGQSRKIVMIQHESGLVDLWGVNQESDAKRKEAFIKDLVDDGYIVMKKSEMVDRLTK